MRISKIVLNCNRHYLYSVYPPVDLYLICDLWKINLEKSIATNWILVYFLKLDFYYLCSLQNQFRNWKSSLSDLIFQNSKFKYGSRGTPARTHSIIRLKSRVLKLTFLALRTIVKSGLEFILKFTEPLQKRFSEFQIKK